MRRAPFLSCLLLLLSASIAPPAFADDVETGSIEIDLRLSSQQKVPEDVLEVLWSEVKVAGTCGGKKISRETIDFWPSDGGPAQRVVTVKDARVGSCAVAFKLFDQKGRVDLRVKSGGTAKGKLTLQSSWARVSVKQLQEGDTALLEYGAGDDKKAIELSTEPQVVPSRDYVVVVEQAGERYDIVSARGLKGDKSWQVYGTIVFVDRVLVDGLKVSLDGKKRFAKAEMVVPARDWDLELTAPGYRSTAQTVKLKPGATWRWTRPLAKATPATVRLVVTGPEDWTLEVDGEPVEVEEGVCRIDTGKHRVAVLADGWKTELQRIDLQEGQESELEFALVPRQIAVVYDSLPQGATVSLKIKGGDTLTLDVADGKASGELAPGRYLATVEAPDHVTWREELVLEIGDPDQTLTPELPSTVVELRWTGLPSGVVLTVKEGDDEVRRVAVQDGEARAKVQAVRVVWQASKTGLLPVEDALDLKPGADTMEIPVAMEVDPAFADKVRLIAFASAGGGLAVVGIAALAGSGGQYAAANAAHQEYLDASDPGDIVDAKERRDAAVKAGQGAEATGWIMVGAAAGTGVAGLITYLVTHKQDKPPPVQALVAPTEGGVVLGFSGRW